MKLRNIIKSHLKGCLFALTIIVGVTASSHAVLSQDLEIHVSINATKSLSAGTTYYHFGALSPNVSSVSATALVITNNSTGLIETYTLLAGNAISDTAGTDWTLAASTGTNQYSLAAQFSTARPADSDAAWDATDYMTAIAQACTTTRFGNGDPAQSGASVNPSATRNLWFRIHTPDITADPGAHTATVTLAVQ